jgi:hypothetical protein
LGKVAFLPSVAGCVQYWTFFKGQAEKITFLETPLRQRQQERDCILFIIATAF